MKRFNIFIDGNQGTTGLELEKVVNEHQKKNPSCVLNIVKLPEKQRKSITARLKMIEQSDITVLCLPDDVAKETIKVVEKKIDKTSLKIIDTSTAFRTDKNWTYGFSEITGQLEKITKSHTVSNPGCYALAFVASIRPISEAKLLVGAPTLTAIGVSGYSGGGKKLIELAEQKKIPSYALYSLELRHKHLQEMQTYALLKNAPIFQPAVIADYRGMVVSTAIDKSQIKTKNVSQTIFEVLKNYYAKSKRIKIKKAFFHQEKSAVSEKLIAGKFLSFASNNNSNSMDIVVAGNDHQCMLHARLDNLGIGAARNALTNLLLMLKR